MNVKIDPSWRKLLQAEFKKEYFMKLAKFVKNEYLKFTVYPRAAYIFQAFNATPFDKVKVVIIGQDPYHEPSQANGLAFSVNKDTDIPPSLQNIFKEIHNDLGKPMPKNGDLSRWAQGGVLLLNATLTVRAHQAASHQDKGWETFTDKVIKILSDKKDHLVFLLWGSYAKRKSSLIDSSKHLILTAAHPSPFSADFGFFGCRHFNQANEYLKKHKFGEIDW